MHIGYVNLFVSDLERALAFYGELLGLHLEQVEEAQGYASLLAGPVRLGLAVVGDDQAELIERHTGIGFVVTDLREEYARLAEAGVIFPMPPQKQPWGGFMALMADPDGNVLYLDEIPGEPDVPVDVEGRDPGGPVD
ncbi:MAG: VOC family protein [Gammaproteobacteria bacterium]|nr:VOC family protein [Gammaproteobacteria bacterium]